ncbi:MAG: excisionase family DNA-binding protein, partial [Paraglaciecola sp.]|nr:excisionase family DNA-binding protein [Paraglaciecola sp.]
MTDCWFSINDISLYLGVTNDTIYKWIEKKGLPAHKIG